MKDRRSVTLSIRVSPEVHAVLQKAVDAHNATQPPITVAGFIQWAAVQAANKEN